MKHGALLSLLGVLSACAPDAETGWADVAPIVARRCIGCHHQAGIAPFPLTEAADFAPRASLVASVIADGTMPPFPPATCEGCVPLDDTRIMPGEERDALLAWLARGPEIGTGMALTPPTTELESPDFVFEVGAEYVPPAGVDDDYRCFVAEGPPRDAYVTALEVIPGDTRVVHHIILFATVDESAAAAARARDESEAGPGYSCFGDAGVFGTRMVGGWAPGERASRFPPGTGVRVGADQPFVVQVHYHPLAEPVVAPAEVQLQTVPSVERPARSLLIAETSFSIPPRTVGYEVDQQVLIGPRTLYGVFPHMHLLGRRITVSLVPVGGGAERTLVDVPAWDFDWQSYYFFQEPVEVGPNDEIRLHCTFDNTTADPVIFGTGTEDEMCLAFVFAEEG